MKSQDIAKILKGRRLPNDYADVVRSILDNDDHDQIIENLDHLAAKVYRMDPDHPRYADWR